MIILAMIRLDHLLDPWKHVLHCRLQLCRLVKKWHLWGDNIRIVCLLLISGITVMKELTATTRAVLDQIRVGWSSCAKNFQLEVGLLSFDIKVLIGAVLKGGPYLHCLPHTIWTLPLQRAWPLCFCSGESQNRNTK